MFRRVMWTAATYGAGVTTSVLVQRRLKRKVRKAAARVGANAVVARGRDLAGTAKYVGGEMAAAVREGRQTMRDTEERLRGEYGLSATESTPVSGQSGSGRVEAVEARRRGVGVRGRHRRVG